MRIFLFMYPIGRFFDEVPESLSLSFEPDHGLLHLEDLYGINRIIEARYRQQGYEIVWVFYGQRGKKYLPDTDDATKYVTVMPDDLLISSGCYTGEPNFDFIFDQLPRKIDELVLGGFHWTSCVAFAADFAIEELKLKACIDEDTTNAYFIKTASFRRQLGRDIELTGETYQPWQTGGFRDHQMYYCEGVLLRPWLVRQPPTIEITFRFDGKLETFSCQEVENYLAEQRRQELPRAPTKPLAEAG